MDVGADGDLHGVASIRCRDGSACPPLSSPRWSSRRRRCCSCGRSSGIEVVEAEARAYFSSDRVGARHELPARPAVALRRPHGGRAGGAGRRRAARAARPAAARSLTGAAAAAAITLASTLAGLPLRAASRAAGQERRTGHTVLGRLGGRRRQGRGDRRRHVGARAARCWSSACGASAATGGRPARRRWRASRVVFTYLGPVVLDPMFNKFTPLPAGATRDDVLELARRGRASRSARSTRSTPRAARPRPTPT